MGYQIGDYANEVRRYIESTIRDNGAEIEQLAEAIFKSLRSDGLLHIFGSGHSALVADEFFHRAGGLAAVNSWTDLALSPLAGPAKNRQGERSEGVAAEFVAKQSTQPGEILLVISNSGVNPFAVDLALAGKAQGLRTWALTSVAHSRAVPSRHSSGKRLFEVVDGVLDTKLPPGDASIMHAGETQSFQSGAASLVIGATILHELEQCVVARFVASRLEPPIYTSANIPGGDQKNQALEKKYASRIARLR